jgi:hypothetical protein
MVSSRLRMRADKNRRTLAASRSRPGAAEMTEVAERGSLMKMQWAAIAGIAIRSI